MTSKPGCDSFDPQAFLAKVGAGKTISSYQKDQIIFSQGDPAGAAYEPSGLCRIGKSRTKPVPFRSFLIVSWP